MLPEVLKQHGRVGLGGEGILRTYGRTEKAREVIQTAVDQGITYFDCARVYSDSERYYGSVWVESSEIRPRIFQASKSAKRDRRGALNDLEESLDRLNLNHIDLWQIHDVRSDEDLHAISGKGGALEAFIEAKSAGQVKFIGVTGHHDPDILTRALTEWPVDAIMMPVNPIEGVLGGFLTSTLSAAIKKGIAVIGMKILGAGHYVQLKQGITPELLIRYALSHDINVAIVGCSNAEEATTLAEVGRDPAPLSEQDISIILETFKPYAQRLAYYRGVI